MGSNDFIKRQRDRDRKMLAEGINVGLQISADYFQMALRDPEAVKTDVFGRERIERVNLKTMELDDYFSRAFSDDVEAERYQEEMDRKLREIWGEDLVPFRERYPSLKEIKYNKARKNWT